MRQDRVQLVRRFGLTAGAFAASAFLAACGGGSAGDPPRQPTAQTITFTAPTAQTMGTTPATLSASASSALAVTLASTTTGVCTVSGSTLTLVAPGTCSLTAAQTITFPSPGDQVIGVAPPALGATASSGLAVGEYVGIFVEAPGLTTPPSATADTPGVQLTNQTTMKFTFGENHEWFASTTNNFGVLLTLGKHYVDANNNNCNVKLLAVVTPTAEATMAYQIPLSSFVVNADCSIPGLTVASALAAAPISQVDFQGDGGTAKLTAGGVSTGSNMSLANTAAPPVYPTTLVIAGAITFQ